MPDTLTTEDLVRAIFEDGFFCRNCDYRVTMPGGDAGERLRGCAVLGETDFGMSIGRPALDACPGLLRRIHQGACDV